LICAELADAQCESGINDGAATPYLMIPLMLITSHSAGKDYVLEILLKDTALGLVGGFALGALARLAFEAAQKRRWIDKESRLVWTIALALFTTGLVSSQPCCSRLEVAPTSFPRPSVIRAPHPSAFRSPHPSSPQPYLRPDSLHESGHVVFCLHTSMPCRR